MPQRHRSPGTSPSSECEQPPPVLVARRHSPSNSGSAASYSGGSDRSSYAIAAPTSNGASTGTPPSSRNCQP
jgi:hypothetical protein